MLSLISLDGGAILGMRMKQEEVLHISSTFHYVSTKVFIWCESNEKNWVSSKVIFRLFTITAKKNLWCHFLRWIKTPSQWNGTASTQDKFWQQNLLWDRFRTVVEWWLSDLSVGECYQCFLRGIEMFACRLKKGPIEFFFSHSLYEL